MSDGGERVGGDKRGAAVYEPQTLKERNTRQNFLASILNTPFKMLDVCLGRNYFKY